MSRRVMYLAQPIARELGLALEGGVGDDLIAQLAEHFEKVLRSTGRSDAVV